MADGCPADWPKLSKKHFHCQSFAEQDGPSDICLCHRVRPVPRDSISWVCFSSPHSILGVVIDCILRVWSVSVPTFVSTACCTEDMGRHRGWEVALQGHTQHTMRPCAYRSSLWHLHIASSWKYLPDTGETMVLVSLLPQVWFHVFICSPHGFFFSNFVS